MSKPFVPKQVEILVLVEITKREALVVQELRAFSFGKLMVHKADNKIIRVEPSPSKIIAEDNKLDIPVIAQTQES